MKNQLDGRLKHNFFNLIAKELTSLAVSDVAEAFAGLRAGAISFS
jgi:hypothetical protein